MRRRRQSGQAMVIVALALLALIGSAALVLLAGSVEWQKDQLQTLADSSALDAALKVSSVCNAANSNAVINEADAFLATQRTRTGSLSIAAGTCATPYHGTDTFAGGLTADYYYPYHAHEQQIEVLLTLNLPIAFGGVEGRSNTPVSRYAVAEALPASVPSVSATTLDCTGGQVNVSGDIAVQNAIALSGGCALYTHERVASGAYSAFGDTTVYADGQSWLVAGGACVAGATSGSTNAICADGYELSGHVSPACAGATGYLSAAGQVVDANPCAAGAGPQPVAPVSTALPPEPNADPSAVATLQGTGGAACTAAGVYPNIVAGGVTWGTGLAPAPTKDAAGFWHFKPSCYGYLNLASVAGGITARQIGAASAVQSHFITATLPAPSQAGTLLVATINSLETPNKFGGPGGGWVSAAEVDTVGEGRSEIWYWPNNPGGQTSATFTMNPATVSGAAQISEWTGVATLAPLDQTGAIGINVATTTAVTATTGAMTQSGELVITDDGFKIPAGQTYTAAAGWTQLVKNNAFGYASEYRLDLPAGVASETVTTSVASEWANTIATFKPATAASGAVLDPGFYYFNGSGFAGGGGICLNGGTLLARDVTLEFVNAAGFSSGSCAAGVGASCGGACQFGSTPCSLSACPPNAGADSPNDLTWFAAPCSSAPAPADAAACTGSAWCPAGDRSCWNELVWAAPASTGQLTVKGSAADAWLLGSIDWPGTCTYQDNGTSMIAGTIACGTLSISAAAGAGTTVGGDAGINTAQAEARLVE